MGKNSKRAARAPLVDCGVADGARRQRNWKRAAFALGFVAALALLALAAAVFATWMHFRNTPSFDEYVAAHPALEPADAALPADAKVLARDGRWSVGEPDAWAVAPERSEGFEAALSVAHGPDPIATLRQRTVYVYAADSPDRTSFATRTETLTIAPGFHAVARICLEDAEHLVGRESAHRGRMTIDLFVLAGGGESQVLVAAVDHVPAGSFTSEQPLTSWPSLLARVCNGSPLPESGLVYHLRQVVHLNASVSNGSSTSEGAAPLAYSLSTEEYSFELRSRVESTHLGHAGFSTEGAAQSQITWDGRAW